MFKFKIDKEAIELLCEVMKKNSLSEIEVKRGSRSIKLSKNNNQSTIINTVQENQHDKKEQSKTDTFEYQNFHPANSHFSNERQFFICIRNFSKSKKLAMLSKSC